MSSGGLHGTDYSRLLPGASPSVTSAECRDAVRASARLPATVEENGQAG